jgi:hypothetical protein
LWATRPVLRLARKRYDVELVRLDPRRHGKKRHLLGLYLRQQLSSPSINFTPKRKKQQSALRVTSRFL